LPHPVDVIGIYLSVIKSGRLPSPKWKNFHGIKVKIKDKIRLNNIIWREWYRQCEYYRIMYT